MWHTQMPSMRFTVYAWACRRIPILDGHDLNLNDVQRCVFARMCSCGRTILSYLIRMCFRNLRLSPGCRSTSRTLRSRWKREFGCGHTMDPWCWFLLIFGYFFDLQYFCHHQPQSLSGLFPFITSSLSVAYSPQNLQIDAVVAPNHTVSMKRGTWTQ